MSFEDLVNQYRHRPIAPAPAPEEVAGESSAVDPRTVLAAALSQTGLSAAMVLASHGVRPVPVGQIKKRFGFDYPEQTSHAWLFPGDLYLLRDGTWWQAQIVTADAASAPPPVIRWAMSTDPATSGSILCPQTELSDAVLASPDPHDPHLPSGRFATTGSHGEPDAVWLWVSDGHALIAHSNTLAEAVAFEQWAAASVAAMIEAR